MKTYIFKRENNNFDDIINDDAVGSKFKTVLSWRDHLLIGTDHEDDEIDSYIILKYGSDLVTQGLIKDFSPVPYVDYMPDPNRPAKFKDIYK